jgi:hypothetical protein
VGDPNQKDFARESPWANNKHSSSSGSPK